MKNFDFGQIYKFKESWNATINLEFPKDALLQIANITSTQIVVNYDSKVIDVPDFCRCNFYGLYDRSVINLSRDYYMSWNHKSFKIMAYNRLIRVESYIEIIQSSEEPKNNGKSDTCYWCGKPTTVLFEQLRICKKCNK